MIKYIREIIRIVILKIRLFYLRFLGHNIDSTARVSLSAFLDKTNPKGIFIGGYTLVARGAVILSHDFTRSYHADTYIGSFCLIGTQSIILPGISIGDHCVIGAGSVVTKNVPSNSLVAGNPAKVIRQIDTAAYGKILSSGNM